jgi:hypothetical protein
VSEYGGTCSGNSRPKRTEEVGEGGFAERAESKAGEGNSKLDTRDDVMQIGDKSFDDLGADVAFCNELADSGESHGDKAEFGGGEETVEDHEEKYADQANDEHAVGRLLCCIVAGGRA